MEENTRKHKTLDKIKQKRLHMINKKENDNDINSHEIYERV